VDRTWAILRPVFIPFGPYVQSHWPYSALGSSSSPVLIPSRGLLLTSSFRSKPTYLLPLLLLDRIRRNRGRVFSTPPPPPPPVPPLRPRYSPLPLDSASAPPLTLGRPIPINLSGASTRFRSCSRPCFHGMPRRGLV
jgi:hypothetical protein